MTPNTITSKDRLTTELDTVKQEGYALDDEECEIGVRCIAAPLIDHNNRVLASISISGPATRIQGDRQTELVLKVKQKAAEISRIL